jgi:hypothetical protein
MFLFNCGGVDTRRDNQAARWSYLWPSNLARSPAGWRADGQQPSSLRQLGVSGLEQRAQLAGRRAHYSVAPAIS